MSKQIWYNSFEFAPYFLRDAINIFSRGELNTVPHDHKLCSQDSQIWGNCRSQHIWSVMGQSRPEKTTFLIMVPPLPGKHGMLYFWILWHFLKICLRISFPSTYVVWKFNGYPDVNHGKNLPQCLPNATLWIVDWLAIEWESQTILIITQLPSWQYPPYSYSKKSDIEPEIWVFN